MTKPKIEEEEEEEDKSDERASEFEIMDPNDYDSDESFDSDEEQGVTNSMGERVNALKRTYSHKCSKCD